MECQSLHELRMEPKLTKARKASFGSNEEALIGARTAKRNKAQNGVHPNNLNVAMSDVVTKLKSREAEDVPAAMHDEKADVLGSSWPADWPPQVGHIDLAVQDLPHASSDIEWWYVNGHVHAGDREYSFFASFFRIVNGWDAEKDDYKRDLALTWAIVDPVEKKYHVHVLVDKNAPQNILKYLDDKDIKMDPRLREAYREVAARGSVPLPDVMFRENGSVALDRLELNYDGNTYIKQADGSYVVSCSTPDLQTQLKLRLVPKKPVQRQGHEGVVKVGLKGDDMFYYFIPRCEASGCITVEGVEMEVSGTAWYDHEFGGKIRALRPGETPSPLAQAKKPDFCWNWLSVQFEDGTDLTATQVQDPSLNHKIVDNFALIVGPSGSDEDRHEYHSAEFKSLDMWTSIRTTGQYPLKWSLVVPEANIDLNIEAAFPEQEVITVIAKPAFWEGRVHVDGTLHGRKVTGVGFLERHGFSAADDMTVFFKRIGKVVLKEVHKLLPLNPTPQDMIDLMADDKTVHYLQGMDPQVFARTVTRPIREIIDRGGKAWRSYALALCVDVVGGDSQQLVYTLAMPELMHVGSLIIDDIQDKSETRRGGPTCHKVHGDAVAINAGTAAYFISINSMMRRLNVTPEVKNTLYHTYLLTLRAGHAGQAFDIAGLDYLMPETVRSGDNARLLDSVVCTHRLKSAGPAGNLARMGALLGGGTEQQQDALSTYMEAVGVAFQIIDDVLNLRGLPGKTHGEDIMAGKVTHPVAMAMTSSRLNLQQREHLWRIVSSKPQDRAVVDEAVRIITDCGALQASEDNANDMIEAAWRQVDPVIPDSFYKINLRAFGWYVLQRHY